MSQNTCHCLHLIEENKRRETNKCFYGRVRVLLIAPAVHRSACLRTVVRAVSPASVSNLLHQSSDPYVIVALITLVYNRSITFGLSPQVSTTNCTNEDIFEVFLSTEFGVKDYFQVHYLIG